MTKKDISNPNHRTYKALLMARQAATTPLETLATSRFVDGLENAYLGLLWKVAE